MHADGGQTKGKISNPVYSAKWCLPGTHACIACIIYGSDSQCGKGLVVAINAARVRKKKANLGDRHTGPDTQCVGVHVDAR